jgi:hypothetical protein
MRRRVSKFLRTIMSGTEAANDYELLPRAAEAKEPDVSHDAEPGRSRSLAGDKVGDPSGTTRMEAMRLVWGRHGLKIMWFSIIVMLIG